MKKIRAILVDDEESARNVLSRLLENMCPDIEVLSKCSNLLDAVEEIKQLQPDVVFLDVQMPNYAGYEIADFIEHINFEIVFITAYDQYAIKAFELGAVDYLVKPIHRDRLREAVRKLSVRVREKHTIEDYHQLLKSIRENEFDQLVVPELGSRRVVSLKSILAIEASGSYCFIHMKDGESIMVSKNLKYFESVIPEQAYIYRVHKSWMVNLRSIKTINKSTKIIELEGGIEARLSKYRIADFEKTLSEASRLNI